MFEAGIKVVQEERISLLKFTDEIVLLLESEVVLGKVFNSMEKL